MLTRTELVRILAAAYSALDDRALGAIAAELALDEPSDLGVTLKELENEWLRIKDRAHLATCVWCSGRGYVGPKFMICRTCHGTGRAASPETLRTATVVLRAKADASDEEVTNHLASLLPSATFITVARGVTDVAVEAGFDISATTDAATDTNGD